MSGRKWQLEELFTVTYEAFKTAIHGGLTAAPSGLTWKELRARLRLPYDRPCPEWTRRLEQDIRLVRRKAGGNALVWAVGRGDG